MAGSLQEQLLKAGLIDNQKAKQIDKEQRTKKKQARKHKLEIEDEAKTNARQAMEEKAERDRELNRQRQEEQRQREIIAQIKQLIAVHKEDRRQGEISYNFTFDGKIKKINVTDAQLKRLSRGLLVITHLDDRFEVVPAPIADKIAQRNPDFIAAKADPNDSGLPMTDEEKEWYKDFEIPDDLMW